MKQFLHLSLVLFLVGSVGLFAQQGIGTNTPNASAALEIDSPDKGVLIPSVSLQTSLTWNPPMFGTADATHDGMIVWNTNTATLTLGAPNDLLGAGFYYWKTDAVDPTQGKWLRIINHEDITIETGTVTNSTLRWNGEKWVEATHLLSHADQVTVTTNFAVDVENEDSEFRIDDDDLIYRGQSATVSVTGDFFLQSVGANATGLISATTLNVSATTVTVNGETTFTDSITLNKALFDSDDKHGNVGEVLSSTETGTLWINPNFGIVELINTTTTALVTSTILVVMPPASNTTTVTLPDADNYPTGFNLKIRRNDGYVTGQLLDIAAAAGDNINAQASLPMNVGYQSVTLVKLNDDNWISIE